MVADHVLVWYPGRCQAPSVPPGCLLVHEQLRPRSFQVPRNAARARADSWPSTARPVCCQTNWQGSFQAGRVNGLADFGRDMITDCFPDLGSTSNISCSNLGVFPSVVSGGTFLQAGRADH